MGLAVAEHEAAAVQEHQHPLGAVGDVEPARHAVGVQVLDPVDVLAGLQGGRRPGVAAHRGQVGRPEAGVADRGGVLRDREGGHGLRVQRHPPSLASSSSTTDGSSLVNTGVGLATGVPTVTGRRSQAGTPE